jgi:MoxR-like ATPase
LNIPEAQQAAGRILDEVRKVIDGKPEATRTALTVLLAEGHLLLEDVPGVGKTMLAKALSRSVGGTISRIQFTPDLLPSDVTGVSIYDQRQGSFVFQRGAVFANVVIGDEINRASPKTQSALLEVMEEGNVTVDGVTRPVGTPFMVIATQNPVEQAGTYRLPEAQLDRFMIKTSIGYPDDAATMRILQGTAQPKAQLQAIITPQTIVQMAELARGVYVNPLVHDYVMRIVGATRRATEVKLGVSVRGAIALSRIVMTWAASQGRTYATPDDVRELAIPALAHRIILEPEAEFDGVTAEAVIGKVLLDVAPPAENGAA